MIVRWPVKVNSQEFSELGCEICLKLNKVGISYLFKKAQLECSRFLRQLVRHLAAARKTASNEISQAGSAAAHSLPHQQLDLAQPIPVFLKLNFSHPKECCKLDHAFC